MTMIFLVTSFTALMMTGPERGESDYDRKEFIKNIYPIGINLHQGQVGKSPEKKAIQKKETCSREFPAEVVPSDVSIPLESWMMSPDTWNN